MKNLKKVLALGLSAAMALSMFVTGAGAAFTDQADIKQTEAVDMLSALGVIQGNPDGSFKPEGTVTRAEMAKMIFTIRSGGNSNADSYASTPTSFTDINGHWAAGYIKYCQSMGIIAGKSATQFDPDGLVTGVEAAKMMLVTMGYNADKAGLVGTTWSSKTLGYANENGLLDDVNSALEQGLPRQYAAQLLYNGLDADTVTYDADAASFNKVETTGLEKRVTNGKDESDPDAQFQWVSVTKNETVGKKYMKLETLENVYISKIEKEDGKDTFSVNNGEFTKVKADYSDLMGQKVKVMIKDSKSDSVYGIYADDDSKVMADGSVGALDTVSTDNKKVKLNGTEYKLDNTIGSTAVTYTNAVSVPDDKDTLSELAASAMRNTIPSYAIKLIDNSGNGKVDRVVVTPMLVGKVTYVGSSSVTAGNKTYKFDDDDIYDGIAKNDYAVIVAGDYTSSGDATLTKASVVTGEITGIKSGTPDQVKVDDTWYKLASGVSTPSVGDKCDLVVVGNYVYNTDVTAGSSKDILYISTNEIAKNDLNTDFTVKARAYFTDGSNKKITITKLNGKDVSTSADSASNTNVAADDLKNMMFTYTTNKDGDYEIKELANAAGASTLNSHIQIAKNTVGFDTYSKSTDYSSKKIAGHSISDDAVIFVHAANEIKVLSGKSVKDWNSAQAAVAKGTLIDEKNGIDYVQIAALTISDNDIPNSDGDKLYAYLTADSFEGRKDNSTVTEFHVWTGSEDTKLYEDGNTNAGLKAGTVIEYTLDGDLIDVKNNLTRVNGDAFAIKGIDPTKKGTVSLVDQYGALSSFDMDEDCVYIGVDDSGTKGVEGNTVDAVTLASQENGAYKLSAYIAFDRSSPKKIMAIVYDKDGELDLTNNTTRPGAVSFKTGVEDKGNGVLYVPYNTQQNAVIDTASYIDSIKVGSNAVDTTAITADVTMVVTFTNGDTTTYTVKPATKLGAASNSTNVSAATYKNSSDENKLVAVGDKFIVTITTTSGNTAPTVALSGATVTIDPTTVTAETATDVTVTIASVTGAASTVTVTAAS